MVVIEPLEYEETTNIDEHNQMVGKINEEIAAINHIEGSTAQAALDAAASAKDAGESASEARTQAFNAARSASEAADDAAKVNQFDARIKSSVTHISTTGTADGVSIGYATDGKPSPLTVVDIPVLSGMGAGVVTPAQMKDISDQLDTLGRDLNNVKAEYLDKYNLTAVQLVRSKTDWEKSPTIPTLKANEYALDDGKRALNAKSAGAHPDLVHIGGEQTITGPKAYMRDPRDFGTMGTDLVNVKNAVTISLATIASQSLMGRTGLRLYPDVKYIGTRGCFGATFDITTVIADVKSYGLSAMFKTNWVRYKDMGDPFYGAQVFSQCADLEVFDTNTSQRIAPDLVSLCPKLRTFVIRNDKAVTPLANVSAFKGTLIESGTGYIYVPDALVDGYKGATNWITYADQIKKLSELPPEDVIE